MIYYAGKPGFGFGWGMANRYLIQELSRLAEVVHLDDTHPLWSSQHLPGDLFVPLQDQDFNPSAACRGRRNFAYTFFEFELTDAATENAKRYDLVFAGSSWCLARMREKGIHNAALLIQGIDPALHLPGTSTRTGEEFLIFSGGKFEFRKGQDLVLVAFRELQDRYADMTLVASWFNFWPDSLQSMAMSPYLRWEWSGSDYEDQMNHLLEINGIRPERVKVLPLLTSEKLVEVYRATDLGVFPNRCEGGTNLVMMEYMACGKPVIASYTSGHRDIVTENNAYPLVDLESLEISDSEDKLVARWEEPRVQDIVAMIEHVYHNRHAATIRGARAAVDLKRLTWRHAADVLFSKMSLGSPEHPPLLFV